MQDYYEILGIPSSASAAEIRGAWRREAFRWHPDRQPTKHEAASERFLDIGEAYAVLGNAAGKARYDNERCLDLSPEPEPRPEARSSIYGEVDLEEVVEAARSNARLFRQEDLVRQVMISLAVASRSVRTICWGIRTLGLVSGVAIWTVLRAVERGNPAVLLVSILVCALAWMLVPVYRARQAEKYREYAQTIVQRRAHRCSD